MQLDRRLPLNTLRAFEAVGRHCHVRRAADELNQTHAALSRQVRLLEQHLGIQLFSRSGKRMHLTSAGRHFLLVVQGAMQDLQAGVVHLDPESLTGELVLATTPTISINWLLQVLEEYRALYPQVDLNIVTIEPHQRILPSEIDIALTLGQPTAPAHVTHKLYQEYYSPVCSPRMLGPDQLIEQPADLLHCTLLHERYQHWEQWFDRQGIEQPVARGNIHFDYGFQSIAAARQGLGVALADRLEVAADLRRGTLIRVLDRMMPEDQGIHRTLEPPQLQTARARLFVAEMLRCLRELGAVLEYPAPSST